MIPIEARIAQLEKTLVELELQRPVLGDSVLDAILYPLREQLEELHQSTHPPPQTEGERKLVTIMFADISGFTALSENLTLEQVRSLINTCFDCLVPVIEKYEGRVDKFIGDAILALFGAPIAYENHAERALRAALEMKLALENFNAERHIELGLHFGINTGLVVAGGIGSQHQQQYSVMGDAVNLAARLEDASENGQILVGQNTFRLAVPLFEFNALPPIKVKGKTEPVPNYQLLGLKASPGTLRGIEGLRSPLVGREIEMGQLQTAFQALVRGKGGSIAITGEAGLGKSRLVAEARESLPTTVQWFEGRALSYTEGMSYWVARDLLDALIGSKGEASLQNVNAALISSVRRFLREDCLEVYPYLARLLDLPLDEPSKERIKYLTAEALRGRIHQAYSTYIRARACEQPLLLVWEDLHWIDPSSLALLETLLPLTKDVPLLLIMVFRSQEGRSFHERSLTAYGEGHQMIDLQPLTRQDSTQLLHNLLNIENFPDAARQLILDKSEGNAFFLEEVLRSLIDAGLVILEGERAVTTEAIHRLKELDVPDTLQGVIAARIDRLPADDKRTLQTAAVIGRVFQKRVLDYLYKHEMVGISLDSTLGELQEREFIRLRADLDYIFKHAITQDVAYNSLLIARRKVLHQVTAEAIEMLFPENLEELSPTLAYHYQRAEVASKAIFYLSKAAERAKATYANAEAIAFYQTAIEQVSQLATDEEQMGLLDQLSENLGDVLTLIGQHEEARHTYQNAVKCTTVSDTIRKARLSRKIAKTWEVQRQNEDALNCHDKAIQWLEQTPSGKSSDWWQEWVQIHLDQLRIYYWMNAVEKAAQLIEEAQPIIETYGTPIQRATFFNSLALTELRRERYIPSVKTVAYAQASARASHELENLSEVAWIQFVYGFVLLWHHALDEAEKQLLGALKLTERIGDVTTQSRCFTYLTVIYRKRKQVDKVREYANYSLESAKTGQMIEYIGMAHANLAWAALWQGNLAEAQAEGQTAFELSKQVTQIKMFPWIITAPLVSIALAQNQLPAAIEYARITNTPEGQPLPEALKQLLEEAIQSWEGGEPETAQVQLERAVTEGQSTGYF